MSPEDDARYGVEVAPGCHGGAFAPVIARHCDLRLALSAVTKSDRLMVRDYETGNTWMLPPQGAGRRGPGRYGRGLSAKSATLWVVANVSMEGTEVCG